MKISGNTILITGAASGIGLEIARLFSQQRNKAIMVDRANKVIQTIKLNHSELNIAILNAGAVNDYSLYSTR